MTDDVVTSEVKTFLLPDVGEGLTEAEILRWHVQPGDTVTVNQTIVEIETAKAAVELPCPYAGVVTALAVAEGDTIDVGTPLLTITTTPPPAPAGGDGEGAPNGRRGRSDSPMSPPSETSPVTREAVLVGYGVKQTAAPQRRARVLAHDPHGTTVREAGPPGEAAKPVRHGGLEVGRLAEQRLSRRNDVLATPPVRKLAKDLAIDLAVVEATGPGGVITRSDVERAASLVSAGTPAGTSAAPSVGRSSGLLGRLGHLHQGPRETRVPVAGVTKVMAAAMVASAFSAPHVTEWVDVDVTRSIDFVERLKARPELAGVRVSPLLLVAAGLIRAVGRHPGINATWDEDAREIVVKHYVNLGIAAATPRGLVVPSVKDAETLDLVGLATALHDLVETAKAGRTTPAQLTGGTITITNVGVFGVDGGTPIMNPGESAILCMGRAALRPWVHDGEVRPRHVMQLTLSFDHRHVDGALGSQVLADVARFLEDPAVDLALG
jgi:2-oxoisovalerate dehydrogenase E2 component (dihydrolipoyl transacylase)